MIERLAPNFCGSYGYIQIFFDWGLPYKIEDMFWTQRRIYVSVVALFVAGDYAVIHLQSILGIAGNCRQRVFV